MRQMWVSRRPLTAACCGLASALCLAAAPAQGPADYVDFGIRIFTKLAAERPNANIVVSPASAGLALSMAYDGAVGTTAIQMAQALRSGTTPAQVDAANVQLLASLLNQHDVTLEIANSVWLDASRAAPLSTYIARVHRAYLARVAQLNFDDPSAPQMINAFVSSATHRKITAIVDRIPKRTVMYIVNATYFKGTWASKFDPSLTKSKPFTLPDGSTRSVPRMDRSGDFDYFETPELQAVRLPYEGDRFSMEVILPRATLGLTDFERTLSVDTWREWQTRFAARTGTLGLPRFTHEWSSELSDVLKSMGVTYAFDPLNAQFFAMYPADRQRNVYISDVVQKTYLKVDEEGSEAAAATRVSIAVASVVVASQPPFRMIVDHPFFCAIFDKWTGAALFFAAVDKPLG